MPGELKGIEERFTGDDRLDWTIVAAAMYDMSAENLDAKSFGHLVAAQTTLLPAGRSQLWLPPDDGPTIPQGVEELLILNSKEADTPAIVEDLLESAAVKTLSTKDLTFVSSLF